MSHRWIRIAPPHIRGIVTFAAELRTADVEVESNEVTMVPDSFMFKNCLIEKRLIVFTWSIRDHHNQAIKSGLVCQVHDGRGRH